MHVTDEMHFNISLHNYDTGLLCTWLIIVCDLQWYIIQPNAFSNIYCGANIYETAYVFTDHSSLRLFCAELMSFCKFTGGQEIQNLQHDNQIL